MSQGETMTNQDDIRQLNTKQEKAILLLVAGLNDQEVADEIGVSRQTVNKWKNQDQLFNQELTMQRYQEWNRFSDRLRSLIPKAIQVIEENLESENPKTRLDAAKMILGKAKLDTIAFRAWDDYHETIVDFNWEPWDQKTEKIYTPRNP